MEVPPLIHELREQFPALDQEVRGRKLAYMDHAATTQKPWAVLRAMQVYYQNDNANVHRGAHRLSERATLAFDSARERIAAWVGAESPDELIFTKGVTEAINLVAASWGRANCGDTDHVLLTGMEHHANIVPWQLQGIETRAIPLTSESTRVDMEAYARALEAKPKLVGIVHVSNSLGVVNPVHEMISMAHAAGALVLVDGAQSLAHFPVDVRALGADFYALSGHKSFGPTGVGALYGRRELLESMPPFLGGGGMIRKVSFEGTTFASIPSKFEPGTPNIAGVIGWGAAIDWISKLPWPELAAYEEALGALALSVLRTSGATVYAVEGERVPTWSFNLPDIHPHDVGTILDQMGIAVRTGHHCCQPLMRHLAIPATVRASLSFTNLPEEIDRLAEGLSRATETLG